MNVNKIATTIKTLNDSELQELVSLLSGFEFEGKSSTMGAMVYSFNTSRAHIANRDDDLRTQAALYGDVE